ncbi:GNAT family N-acetyltransferase [Actinoplanes sp. NPDC051851]|uniref:GNAT family N-acetyltransferase n=1 Tax=Actinoplanes sp. NPDC051851 TaxID=3154753 RepID=UPI003422D553
MGQPGLTTDRLRLVPLGDEHLEDLIALDADPEVTRFLYGRPRTRDDVIASHAERMALGRRVDGLGYWVAVEEGVFAGLMMLPPGRDPGTAELGYRIPRRRWRRGIASEASRALLRHGFATVGLERVYAQTMAVNVGSRAVMDAVGLRYVRTFHEEWPDPLPGAEEGEVEYEITRAMWTLGGGPRGSGE